jgi:formylglycine-generating enzyme
MPGRGGGRAAQRCGPDERPQRTPRQDAALRRHAQAEAAIPAGTFAQGDAFGEGYPDDGEAPVHTVALAAYRIDAVTVTNRAFADFVADTGYRTDAERLGSSAVFQHLVRARPQDVLGRVASAPWWLGVAGASWKRPFGRLSNLADLMDHPVVHVSWQDALAYCAWAGRRLPTEAEWERAARGGVESARFPWGDEMHPGGAHAMNVWQGEFPDANSGDDGFLGTAPARTFAPNGFGLFQAVGNVWEWCADRFDAGYYAVAPAADPRGPDRGDRRVLRGGSYLCHASYCHRYRVAARSANTPDSSSGNCGFRTVAAPE